MTAYAVEGRATNLRVCLSCVEAVVEGLGATPDADTSVTVTVLTGDAIGAGVCEWCGGIFSQGGTGDELLQGLH